MTDFKLATYFIVLINPFSQVLYMWDLMKELTWREFASVYARASLLSFGVFAVFSLTGDILVVHVFQVRTDALRVFGGLIMLLIALRFFTHGAGSSMLNREDAHQLAPSIALPYMVGPGTIWVSIMLGRSLPMPIDLAHIVVVLALNLTFVAAFHNVITHIESAKETLLGSYFHILMRTNGLFIGAIGVEMILSGLGGAGVVPAQ